MWNLIKNEFRYLGEEITHLHRKTTIVFIISTILFVLSWYFANPEFFNQAFTFKDTPEPIVQDLISFAYWFALDFTLFFIIPVYFIKLVFKEPLKNFGLTTGIKKTGIFFLLISLVVLIPVIFYVYYSDEFTSYFPLMQSATENWKVFLIYEIMFLLFIFSWEFIFRGFMLFALEEKFGIYAIFIQMIPFVILHSDKPFIETFSSIFGGLFLGYLAFRTRSIYYGFFIHSTILIFLDVLSYLNI